MTGKPKTPALNDFLRKARKQSRMANPPHEESWEEKFEEIADIVDLRRSDNPMVISEYDIVKDFIIETLKHERDMISPT